MLTQQERRLSRRNTPHRSTFINVDSDYPGMVLDISEGGLRFRVIDSLGPSRQIHFWFVANSKRIRGTGDLVWTDEDRKTGGLQFTNLSEETRDQIGCWLADFSPHHGVGTNLAVAFEARDTSSASNQRATYKVPVRRVPVRASDTSLRRLGDQSPVAPLTQPSTRSDASRRGGLKTLPVRSPETDPQLKGRPPLRAISVSLLGMIIAMSAYIYHRETGERMIQPGLSTPKPDEAQTATLPSEKVEPQLRTGADLGSAGENAPTPLTSKGQTTDGPSQSPLAPNEQFVVQVAAVRHNAETRVWIESLREKGLPVFVRKTTVDGFYRVLVGPYPDKEAARTTQRELEKAGYESFIRH